MDSSMLKAAGLNLWTNIRCWTLRWIVSLLQDVHQPRASKPILETETVFQEVLDTQGNIVYGTNSSEWEDMYLLQSDKEIASRVTLLRGYVTS